MQEIRRENLRRLSVQWGGVGKLAEKLGYANASFLVQMCGPHPIREVTERTARRVEETLELPRGWLDQPVHEDPGTPDLVSLVRAVADALTEADMTVTPAKFADIVAVVYKHTGQTVDNKHIKSVVALLK